MLPRAFLALLLSLTVASSQLIGAEPAEIVALRAKAMRGNAIAQYNLGLAYAEGKDVPTDLSEAFVWLTLAEENGSTGKALQAVLDSLSEAQLTEGRRRLEDHRSAMAVSAKAAPRITPPITIVRNGPPEPVSTAIAPAAPALPAPAVAPSSVHVESAVASPTATQSVAEELASLQRDHRQLSDELALAWKENAALKKDLDLAQATLAENKVRIAAQETALAQRQTPVAAPTAAPEIASLTAELTSARQELEKFPKDVERNSRTTRRNGHLGHPANNRESPPPGRT